MIAYTHRVSGESDALILNDRYRGVDYVPGIYVSGLVSLTSTGNRAVFVGQSQRAGNRFLYWWTRGGSLIREDKWVENPSIWSRTTPTATGTSIYAI